MKYNLSSDQLVATIDSKGAELTSLKKRGGSTEYIWKADKGVWGRHAPLLFPIVGRLKDDLYTFKGKSYVLGQHGFARNMEFTKIDSDNDLLVFELCETKETLEMYPFQFSLKVTYQFRGNTLLTKYEVANKGGDDMYFSIGGHPGFTCPIEPSDKRSEYYLEFEHDEEALSHILRNGTISTSTKSVIDDKKIRITDNIFDEDALIFKDLKSQKVSLKDKSHNTILHFHFEHFPYLGIWSISQSSPYVCIEPWFGIADNHDHNGELTEKEGVQKLAPKVVFQCEYGIEIV